MMKKQNGITLIALVITIIVLLILAGVSIAMLTGDNGILTQATRAKSDTIEGEVADRINMAINGEYANILADGAMSSTVADTIKSSNGLVDENGITYTVEVDGTDATLKITGTVNGKSIVGSISKPDTDGKYTITKAPYPTRTNTSTGD